MATPEGRVKAKITRLLKQNDVWYTMPIQRGFSKPGVPDYLCLKHGLFFTVEAKAGKNAPTKAQVAEMIDLRNHGAVTWVVNEDALPGFALWLANL